MTQTTTAANPDQAEQFLEQLVGFYSGGLLALMIDVGNRTGLFEAAAEGPASSAGLASRAGLTERYVREWLGAMVTGGIFEYDSDTETYTLPPWRAACLTGSGQGNLAHLSGIVRFLGKNVPDVARAFRDGGGVPYDKYFPAFTDFADGVSRGTYEELLPGPWVRLCPGLAERLTAGARVADIGCATGASTNALALAFGSSTFTGYDIIPGFIDRARAEARDKGLANVSFEALDVADLPGEPKLDVVFALDVIHDLTDPLSALVRIRETLVPDGTLVMVEPDNSSSLKGNLDHPIATLMYTASTLHCMPVSLASGGPGLGLVWGRERATEMLTAAGFADVTRHPAPGDPFNAVYFARATPEAEGR
jgi:SAM-dependent methyltransferase